VTFILLNKLTHNVVSRTPKFVFKLMICLIGVFMLMSGPEITHDLIQLLQKRLDDAVLNDIILTLSRNQMYKLSPEDVQVVALSVQNVN